jgi:F-type H+-transporting ATPase subunit delta
LGKATGKNVEVKVIVDESVIGGIIARVGDTVIDGSIARRVDSLRQALNTR